MPEASRQVVDDILKRAKVDLSNTNRNNFLDPCTLGKEDTLEAAQLADRIMSGDETGRDVAWAIATNFVQLGVTYVGKVKTETKVEQ